MVVAEASAAQPVVWETDLEAAEVLSFTTGTPLFVHFVNGDEQVQDGAARLDTPAVRERLRLNFITVRVDRQNEDEAFRRFGVRGTPAYVILRDGRVFERGGPWMREEVLADWLNDAAAGRSRAQAEIEAVDGWAFGDGGAVAERFHVLIQLLNAGQMEAAARAAVWLMEAAAELDEPAASDWVFAVMDRLQRVPKPAPGAAAWAVLERARDSHAGRVEGEQAPPGESLKLWAAYNLLLGETDRTVVWLSEHVLDPDGAEPGPETLAAVQPALSELGRTLAVLGREEEIVRLWVDPVSELERRASLIRLRLATRPAGAGHDPDHLAYVEQALGRVYGGLLRAGRVMEAEAAAEWVLGDAAADLLPDGRRRLALVEAAGEANAWSAQHLAWAEAVVRAAETPAVRERAEVLRDDVQLAQGILPENTIPAAADPEAVTQHDTRALAHRFYREVLVADHRSAHNLPAGHADVSTELLEAAAFVWAYGDAPQVYRPDEMPSDAEMNRLLDATADLDLARDERLWLARLLLTNERGNWWEIRQAGTAAAVAFEQAEGQDAADPAVRLKLWSWASREVRHKDEARAAVVRAAALVAAAELVLAPLRVAGEKGLDDRATRCDVLENTLFPYNGIKAEHQAEVVDRVEATRVERGGDAGWLELMLRGKYHVEAAWDARGGGRARTVKPEGWKGFNEHLDLAFEALNAAHQAEPSYRHAATDLIAVAGGRSDRLYQQEVFDAAVAAQFDHPEAWRKHLWFLRPRWGGSLREMMALGLRAVATRRHDTQTPRFLLKVLKELADEGVEDTQFHAMPYPVLVSELFRHQTESGVTPTAEALLEEVLACLRVGLWADAASAMSRFDAAVGEGADELLHEVARARFVRLARSGWRVRSAVAFMQTAPGLDWIEVERARELRGFVAAAEAADAWLNEHRAWLDEQPEDVRRYGYDGVRAQRLTASTVDGDAEAGVYGRPVDLMRLPLMTYWPRPGRVIEAEGDPGRWRLEWDADGPGLVKAEIFLQKHMRERGKMWGWWLSESAVEVTFDEVSEGTIPAIVLQSWTKNKVPCGFYIVVDPVEQKAGLAVQKPEDVTLNLKVDNSFPLPEAVTYPLTLRVERCEKDVRVLVNDQRVGTVKLGKNFINILGPAALNRRPEVPGYVVLSQWDHQGAKAIR